MLCIISNELTLLRNYRKVGGVFLHTEETLLQQLAELGIDPKGTLLVHSSMKSIGQVEGGADTVLDAFSTYMKDGLLVLPAMTWSYINRNNPYFYVNESESCVGILTELFWRRPNVVRSLHPTHSVAALGKDAKSFTEGDEKFDTPCARGSVYGKMLDRQGQILLVGVDLRRCTFIHGIEEWMDVPGRVSDHHEQLYTVLPDGTKISAPQRRHTSSWSEHYWKVEEVLAKRGAITYGKFGDADVIVCDTVKMYQDISKMLAIDLDLFGDNEPLADKIVDIMLSEKEHVKIDG